MDISLTYAVPVHIVDLGANLSAYINTKPAITALRLCNRFGKGDRAFITKLPIEVMSEIEALVIQDARDEEREDWENELRCFEWNCDDLDHLSDDEKDKIYDFHEYFWFEAEEEMERGYSPSDEERDRVVRDAVDRNAHLSNQCHDVHWNRIDSWDDRFLNRRPFAFTGHERSDKHCKLIAADFGVQIWTSHVRLGDPTVYNDAPRTTVAYLTLPKNPSCSLPSHLADCDCECDHEECDSGYGIPILPGKGAPTKHSLRRFERAMKILGLKVFVHPSQKGRALAMPGYDVGGEVKEKFEEKTEVKTAYDAAAWPQLTLLVRKD